LINCAWVPGQPTPQLECSFRSWNVRFCRTWPAACRWGEHLVASQWIDGIVAADGGNSVLC
jgi:hypothetical protein